MTLAEQVLEAGQAAFDAHLGYDDFADDGIRCSCGALFPSVEGWGDHKAAAVLAAALQAVLAA